MHLTSINHPTSEITPQDFPLYLKPRRITLQEKKTHDLFLKKHFKLPLEIEPGPHGTSIAQVPYQFLREHRFYQAASYAIGPHPYLIERFLRTNIENCKHLQIKPESSINHYAGEAHIQRKSHYSHKKLSRDYQIQSLSIRGHNDNFVEFEAAITSLHHLPVKSFDYLFIPSSSRVPAQFSTLENRTTKENSGSLKFNFSLLWDLKETGMIPWHSTFFLVSCKRKEYAPVEVYLDKALVPLVSKLRIDNCFNSVVRNQPTNLLIWGTSGSGKTSFCASTINTLHIHNDSIHRSDAPETPLLNFTVTSDVAPNPMILYPSSLLGLLDSGARFSCDQAELMKIIEHSDRNKTSIDVACLVVDINQIDDQPLIANTFAYYDYLTQINKIAILILTKVDLYDSQKNHPLEPSLKLDKAIFALQEYGFTNIVPMMSYRKNIDTSPNEFTRQAVNEVLSLSRTFFVAPSPNSQLVEIQPKTSD